MSQIEEIDKKLVRARKLVDKVKDPQAFKALDAIAQVLELMFMDIMPHGAQVVTPEQYEAAIKKASEKVAVAQKVQQPDKPKAGGVVIGEPNGNKPKIGEPGGGLYL